MVDSAIVRKWVLDANDGIISTTGIMQGFAGAGASEETVLFAALAVMVSGALSCGGSAYAEAAQDRLADIEVIEEQERQLALSPDEEVAELRAHYEQRGLDPRLANEVAHQLARTDPLGAKLETEFGMLGGAAPLTVPWAVAFRAAGGFLSGALPLTLAVVFVPEPLRFAVSMLVVIVSLTATGVVSARSGIAGHPLRAVVRSIAIGLFIALLSFAAGNIFDLLDQLLPQIEVDPSELVSPSPTFGP